jgi:nucleoside-diphosphate-sugar epimerase
MRVLVAGGAGFVGSHLVELLLARADEVTVVDNFLTGSAKNLAHLRAPQLTVVRGDAERAPDGEFDRVYHLASPASPEAYARHQIATLMANSAGTKRLLEIAHRGGARLLLASTSEVYGDPAVHPQPETYWGNVDPIGPRSMYDEGKRFAEALTVAFARELGSDVRIARIFNAYGPRMQLNDGRMPSAFIAAAIRGEAIPVHGDGRQTRSLCYVGDTARGLIAAMESGQTAEVYNIGRMDEISVLDFARVVVQAAGTDSEITFVPGRPQDIQRRCPDTTKTERELGWRATTSLQQGLRTTVAWYRHVLAGLPETEASVA